MSFLDSYNDRVLERLESRWLDPDYDPCSYGRRYEDEEFNSWDEEKEDDDFWR